jgi:hypothetical protein
MAQATRDSIGVASKIHGRKPALYSTPVGYTSRRPAAMPPIDRAALMGAAHAIARQFRAHFVTYREALAYGLGAAWRQAKAARTMQSLALQVARPAVPATVAQIEASRRATRRCGSSLWAS